MFGPGFWYMGKKEQEEVEELFLGWHLSRFGPEDNPYFRRKTFQLEEAIAARVGVKYAIGMNSGTSALFCALKAVGVDHDCEVIVPGYTYVATIGAVINTGATPVLAEIDESFNLNPEDVERKIWANITKAIVAVHMLGNPAKMDKLREISDRYGVPIIEDCAQAFGAKYHGRPVGSLGKVGAFSFNSYKVINAGEGGMLVTDDEEVYRKAFAYHDQGHSPLRLDVTEEEAVCGEIGWNFRMNELTAAVLLAQERKTDFLLNGLRGKKKRFTAMVKHLPIAFREVTDRGGECATILTAIFPSQSIARRIAKRLGTKVVADSGWHVYSNMKHFAYRPGLLPQTDELLNRSIHIGIGVRDPGLGSSFGITPVGRDDVEHKAKTFCQIVTEELR